MATVAELIGEINKLDRRQRTALFLEFLDDTITLAPGIVSTSGICGGNARIEGTRIPVWGLERSRQLGMTDERLLQNYPSLKPSDLTHAWDYVSSHSEEIEAVIRLNEEA